VDRGERRSRALCLVGLQVTEQMPSDIQVAGVVDLLQGLLYAVLAEVTLAGGPRLTDEIEGERFGDGDETN
jgi:hypothetical protein